MKTILIVIATLVVVPFGVSLAMWFENPEPEMRAANEAIINSAANLCEDYRKAQITPPPNVCD